mmetsp:Transcript_6355/g.7698  ORF Transcript_6355/g.7698 Transcript_6355/m.7698 type:complete len:80 (+) Transcript_6355:397-636(+)
MEQIDTPKNELQPLKKSTKWKAFQQHLRRRKLNSLSDFADPLDNFFGVDFAVRNLDKEMCHDPFKRTIFDESYNLKDYF